MYFYGGEGRGGEEEHTPLPVTDKENTVSIVRIQLYVHDCNC